MSDFSVTVKPIVVREVNAMHGKKHTACIINHRRVTHAIKCKLCVLKVVSVYVLCTDADLMDHIDFNVQTFHFKGGIVVKQL